MSKDRLLLVPDPNIELTQLFQNLKTIPEQNNRETHAALIVKVATEQRFDAFSAVTVLLHANMLWQTRETGNRRIAERIFRGVNQYFGGREVNFKMAFPATDQDVTPEQQDFLSLATTDSLATLEQMQQKSSVEHPFLLDFLRAVGDYNAKQEPGENSLIMTSRDRQKSLKDPNFADTMKAYLSIFNRVDDLVTSVSEDQSSLVFAEEALSIAEEASQTRSRILPDILTVPYNGVSLKGIFSEEDREVFKRKALRYMAGLPKGDFFWAELCEGLFFRNAIGKPSVGRDFFKRPELIERIFLFQEDIVNQLLGPTVLEEAPDATSDRLLQEAIANLEPFTMKVISFMMFNHLTYAHFVRQMLFPDSDPHRLMPSSKLAAEIVLDGARRLGHRTYLVDQAVSAALGHLQEKLRKDWEQRFPKSIAARRMQAGVDDFLENIDPKVAHQSVARRFFQEMLDQIPNEKMGKLEEFDASIDEFLADQKAYYPSATDTRPWPSRQPMSATYAEGDVRHQLGLASVNFFPGERLSDPTEFLITTANTNMDIMGSILANGEISDLSVQLGETYPVVQGIIEKTVRAAFLQLLSQEDLLQNSGGKSRENAGRSTRSHDRRQINDFSDEEVEAWLKKYFEPEEE